MVIKKLTSDLEELRLLIQECQDRMRECNYTVNSHKSSINYIDELNLKKESDKARAAMCFIKSRVFCYFLENKYDS